MYILRKILVILSVMCICTCVPKAMAIDLNNTVEILPNSSDFASVKEASSDICKLINSFNSKMNFNSSEINWNNVYKIYVDNKDVFKLNLKSKSELVNEMDYIWSYMDNICDENICVTISKASTPQYELVEQGVISEEKYQELINKAGTWTASEAEIDTIQTVSNIEKSLENAGVESSDDVILIGGSVKLKSLFAITFKNGQVDKLIPLASPRLTVSDNNMTLKNMLDDELKVGESYDFSHIADILNNVSITNDITGGTTSNRNIGTINNDKIYNNENNHGSYKQDVLIILPIIIFSSILVFFVLRKCKNKN